MYRVKIKKKNEKVTKKNKGIDVYNLVGVS